MLHLSYSGFKRYQNCPKLYELSLTQPLIAPPEAANIGTIVQAVFENMVKEKIQDQSAVEASIDRIMHEISDKFGIAVSEAGKFSVIEAIKVSFDVISGLIPMNCESEVTLKTELNGMSIEGRLDFLSRTHDFVLDGKASPQKEKYIDFDQLTFYAYLFYRNFGRIPKTGFIWYFHGETKEVYQSIPRLEKLRDKVVDTVELIKQGRFDARTKGWHCKSCPEAKKCLVALYNDKKPLTIGSGALEEIVGL